MVEKAMSRPHYALSIALEESFKKLKLDSLRTRLSEEEELSIAMALSESKSARRLPGLETKKSV